NVDALLAQATKARDDAKALIDSEAKKKAEVDKRKADRDRLAEQGRTALAAKRYNDAVKAYGDALKLSPNDAELTKGLADAEKALSAEKTAEADKAAKAKQLQQHIDAGKTALAARKYDDAIREFNAADKLAPNDRTVDMLLAQATKARDDAKAL